jgi:hypothetical protein
VRAWTGFLETSSLLARLVHAQQPDIGSVPKVQYEILTRLQESPGHRNRMTEQTRHDLLPQSLNSQAERWRRRTR